MNGGMAMGEPAVAVRSNGGHSPPYRWWALAAALVAGAALYPAVRKAMRPAELIDALGVEGLATLDGAPMPRGCVTFMPAVPEENGGRPGLARIEPDGRFRVGNANPGRPIKMRPGEYVVTVLALDDGGPVPRTVSPPDYADIRKTPLRATLALGPNRIDLVLRSKHAGQ